MPRSKSTLTLAGALCAVSTFGCGAVFHGAQQTIEIKSADPKARVLKDGTVIGASGVKVIGWPSNPPVVFIEDSKGNVVRFVPKSKVSWDAIVLDTLWCVTILGVAAPISDALIGGFSRLEQPETPITVPPSPPRKRIVQYALAPAQAGSISR